MLTRLRCLSILLALSCGHPATRPAGMGAARAFTAMTGDIQASVQASGIMHDRSSRSKCSTPPRPLFRPEYGNR